MYGDLGNKLVCNPLTAPHDKTKFLTLSFRSSMPNGHRTWFTFPRTRQRWSGW